MQISSGLRPRPVRTLLIGIEGVGKTGFAVGGVEETSWTVSDPGVIMLDCDEGSGHVDVARASWDQGKRVKPKTLDEVLTFIWDLSWEDHSYKVLVIDTADALEAILRADLCERSGWSGIEDVGFGKGYVAAHEEWIRVLHGLDNLRETRGMEVVIICHAARKKVVNPDGTDYVRWEPKLYSTARTSISALLKEWSDAVLFAEFEQFVTTESHGDTVGKAISTGARILHTIWTAAHDGKNRLGLPPTLPLDWAAYVNARQTQPAAQPVTAAAPQTATEAAPQGTQQ